MTFNYSEYQDETYSASFCPEDNKLRLYVGRVPRPLYDALRKAGFTPTPKQECDFVATWKPSREDICLALISDDEDIGDEDYSPQERAADRAERFSDYRDKRRSEAHGHADRYDSGPDAFGNQNRQRAERQAARHERHANRACTQWGKAEYWQTRTQAVISHAKYKSRPQLRRGRIKEYETQARKIESHSQACSSGGKCDVWWEDGIAHTLVGSGRGRYPRPTSSLTPSERDSRWIAHYQLLIEYERAMIGDDMAAEQDFEVGGKVGKHLIHRVNRSKATGRVVSLGLWGEHPWRTDDDGKPAMGVQSVNIERMGQIEYHPPTPESLAELASHKKASKKTSTAPKLINPTLEDAERLQAIWNDIGNARAYQPKNPEPLQINQARYSANSKGSYSPYESRSIDSNGCIVWQHNGAASFKLRILSADLRIRIIVLTDKPQKPLPLDWEAVEAHRDETIADKLSRNAFA